MKRPGAQQVTDHEYDREKSLIEYEFQGRHSLSESDLGDSTQKDIFYSL